LNIKTYANKTISQLQKK